MTSELVALSGVMVILPPSNGDCCGRGSRSRLTGCRGGGRRTFHHAVQDLGHVCRVGVFQIVDIDLAAGGRRHHVEHGNQFFDVFFVLVAAENDQGVEPGIGMISCLPPSAAAVAGWLAPCPCFPAIP